MRDERITDALEALWSEILHSDRGLTVLIAVVGAIVLVLLDADYYSNNYSWLNDSWWLLILVPVVVYFLLFHDIVVKYLAPERRGASEPLPEAIRRSRDDVNTFGGLGLVLVFTGLVFGFLLPGPEWGMVLPAGKSLWLPEGCRSRKAASCWPYWLTQREGA